MEAMKHPLVAPRRPTLAERLSLPYIDPLMLAASIGLIGFSVFALAGRGASRGRRAAALLRQPSSRIRDRGDRADDRALAPGLRTAAGSQDRPLHGRGRVGRSGARVRCGGARRGPLDRAALLPVPAVRVRQGAAVRLAGGLRLRARAEALPARRHARAHGPRPGAGHARPPAAGPWHRARARSRNRRGGVHRRSAVAAPRRRRSRGRAARRRRSRDRARRRHRRRPRLPGGTADRLPPSGRGPGGRQLSGEPVRDRGRLRRDDGAGRRRDADRVSASSPNGIPTSSSPRSASASAFSGSPS